MLDIKEYLKQTKTVLLTHDAFDELMQRASAQPQRTGRWEMVSQHENPPTYIYSCSECRHKSFGFYNFCPHCGARMEGER